MRFSTCFFFSMFGCCHGQYLQDLNRIQCISGSISSLFEVRRTKKSSEKLWILFSFCFSLAEISLMATKNDKMPYILQSTYARMWNMNFDHIFRKRWSSQLMNSKKYNNEKTPFRREVLKIYFKIVSSWSKIGKHRHFSTDFNCKTVETNFSIIFEVKLMKNKQWNFILHWEPLIDSFIANKLFVRLRYQFRLLLLFILSSFSLKLWSKWERS